MFYVGQEYFCIINIKIRDESLSAFIYYVHYSETSVSLTLHLACLCNLAVV